jgi:hypothetical protein
LLPALVDAYSGQGPLCAKFRDALTNAVPARGPKLSTTLRTIGKTLDETHLGH